MPQWWLRQTEPRLDSWSLPPWERKWMWRDWSAARLQPGTVQRPWSRSRARLAAVFRSCSASFQVAMKWRARQVRPA
jgi:hypothetical protein